MKFTAAADDLAGMVVCEGKLAFRKLFFRAPPKFARRERSETDFGQRQLCSPIAVMQSGSSLA